MSDCTLNLVRNVRQIKDGRRKQGKRYSSETIIWILILGLLCGEENLAAIYDLFLYKKSLVRFLVRITGKELKTIPHVTTISRALAKMNWQNTLLQLLTIDYGWILDELLIAVDGKTLRGIHNGTARHILSLVNQDCLPLTQCAVSTKENEIIAFKRLLSKVVLPPGTIITADALLTQAEIIEMMEKKKLDYVFKVKDNQKELKSQLTYIFRQGLSDQTYPLKIDEFSKEESNHDRETIWKVVTTTDFNSTDLPVGFSSVKTLGFIYTITKRPQYELGTGIKTYVETNNLIFLISSTNKSAQELFSISRGHWRIENNLHWLKDTLYREDQQTLSGSPAHLFTFLKSLTLGLIRQITHQISKFTRRFLLDSTYQIYVLNRLGIC